MTSIVKRQGVRELKKITKERGIKLKSNAGHDEIRLTLGMDANVIPSRFTHCEAKKPPHAIIKTNTNTGEETRFNSIYELARDLNLFAGSITYRIRTGKSFRNSEGEFTFRRA